MFKPNTASTPTGYYNFQISRLYFFITAKLTKLPR